ncbi:hypothetical protein KQI76_07140 [Amphibacillus sp. MSJ-3]|uniref:ribonuclease YeeF family protein n=1 Tax=Amphibacillus sp. MSJ-3 TaxID=2841505 RepID=UPI001C0E9EE9|nr:T7SS effector LXG polymorphic toxin [Amphibacillus sp. MSJ-3]MBU5594936.1 hypothetical protein [Amphibacillus sp. MSJ-3]
MKQLNAERLRDTMEVRIKHYQSYREQLSALRQIFEEIVGLEGFSGRGATAIKGFYQGQMDVIDAWFRLIDRQISFFEGVPENLSDFKLGGQTIVDTEFLNVDLAQREIQADQMVSDQRQTLRQIFTDIDDLMTLSPFSRDQFDQQMSDLRKKRIETIDTVDELDQQLTTEYSSSLYEQDFLIALFDTLLTATRKGGDISVIHFNADAYHKSDIYQNIESAQAYTATYFAHREEQDHARQLRERAWYEVVWDGAKTFVGEVTGYYDTIRATTGVDPVTGVEYTAGQRIAYAGLAAAGFIPFVGWAGRALRGSKGIYATVKGVKALDTSLDIYKAANAFSMIKQVEMGLYGLAAANGFSDAITGRDIFGNALNAEQRSASLMQGIGASIPFVPSAVKQGKYMTNQALETISNMNLTQGSNGFRIFGQNQGGLQRWLGNKHIQPAFAGSVPEVPIRVMDQRHINKKLDMVYSKRVGSGNIGEKVSKVADKVDGLNVSKGKVGDKIPMEDFQMIRKKSLHNIEGDSMTLGKYTPSMENGTANWGKAGPDSYIGRAGKDSMYFDLGSEWGQIQKKYNLTNDEMFEYFNIPALDDAVKSGKEIRFSHDPRLSSYKDSYLRKEWEYLKDKHNFSILIEEGGVWYAE